MLMPENSTYKAWSQWWLMRMAEVVLFTLVFFIVTASRQGGDIIILEVLRFAAAFVVVYAGILLYAPLSAAVWWLLSRGSSLRMRLVVGSIFFLVHGYIAFSVMYNGMLGISRSIGFANNAELAWLGVAILHVILILYWTVKPRN